MLITRGQSNSLEINIGLFHAKQARYELYQIDMRQPRQVRCVLDKHGIQEAVQLRFISQGKGNQIISRSQGVNINEGITKVTSSLDLKILKKRI